MISMKIGREIGRRVSLIGLFVIAVFKFPPIKSHSNKHKIWLVVFGGILINW